MQSRCHLNHSVIVHYIQNNLTENEKKIVYECKNDSQYAFIFKLVDSVPGYTLRPGTSQLTFLSYFDMEESLVHILSGNANMKEQQLFVNTLYHSRDVCEKLMHKLDEIRDDETDDEILADIDIKNDAILLDFMDHAIKVPASYSRNTFETSILGLITRIANFVKNELYPPPRWIKYAIVGLAPIVLFCLYHCMFQKKDVFTYYFNKNNIPQEYHESSLRGYFPEPGVSSQLDTFITGFKYGISDYLMRDYPVALNTWQPLRPYAQILEKDLENEHVQDAVRDYYFYFGITQLALVKDKATSKEKQKEFLGGAISDLNRALDIALVQKRTSRDREYFFLGLAYVVAGQENFALHQLKMIEADSPFYKDRGELIKRIDSN